MGELHAKARELAGTDGPLADAIEAVLVENERLRAALSVGPEPDTAPRAGGPIPAPDVDKHGTPWCTGDECGAYDGKRCELLGQRPDRICEPAVIDLARRYRGAGAMTRRQVGRAHAAEVARDEARDGLRALLAALFLDDTPRLSAIKRAQTLVESWGGAPTMLTTATSEPAPTWHREHHGDGRWTDRQVVGEPVPGEAAPSVPEPTPQDWKDAAEAGGVDVSAVPYGAAVASRVIRIIEERMAPSVPASEPPHRVGDTWEADDGATARTVSVLVEGGGVVTIEHPGGALTSATVKSLRAIGLRRVRCAETSEHVVLDETDDHARPA